MSRDRKNTAIYVAYDDHEPPDGATPEKSLLTALLVNALSDLRKPGEKSRKAMEYFLSPEEDYIFSFKSVCCLLDIDPDSILVFAGLRKGKDRYKVNGVAHV